MISGRTIAIGAALVAAVLTLLLWPKKQGSAEEEIRALVAQCVRAAEDKELSVIAEAMAADFKGPNNASRDDVKGILTFQLLRNAEATTVFNPSLEVTVTGPDGGELSGKFVFARGKPKSFEQVGEAGVISAYQIDAKLQRRDGKWKFVSASYRPL
jgi:hypothetical protein